MPHESLHFELRYKGRSKTLCLRESDLLGSSLQEFFLGMPVNAGINTTVFALQSIPDS